MNRITKKKITSVAMAVTLTVLAPIKLNSENKIDKASVFAGENTKIVLEEKEGGKTIRLDCGNGTFLNSKFQNQGIQLVPATNNNEKQKMHMPEINKDNSGKKTTIQRLENGEVITLTEEPAQGFPTMENKNNTDGKVELKKDIIKQELKINIPEKNDEKVHDICKPLEDLRRQLEDHKNKKINEKLEEKKNTKTYEEQRQEWLRKIDEEQIKAEKTKVYGEYNKLFREYFEWKKINEPKENRKTSNPSLSGKSEIGKLGSLEGETKNPGIAGGINKGSLSGSEGENNNSPILGISGKTDIKRLKGLEGDNEVQKIKDKKEAEKEYEKRRKERERIETEQGKERERQKELEDLDKKRAENESKEKEQEEQMKRDEERQNKEIEKVNHRVELSKEKAENIHRIIGDFNESINNLKDLNNNWVCFSQEIVNEIEIYKNYGEKASKELDKILAENKEDKNIRTLLDRVESSGNRLSQIFENIRCEVYAKTGFYIEYRY